MKLSETHLVDEKRIELAIDFLKHELKKILLGCTKEIQKYLNNIRPDESSNDEVVRDFWNFFSAISGGYLLKLLIKDVTAENYQWEHHLIPLNRLRPETRLGWMREVKETFGEFSLNLSLNYFQANPDSLNKAIEKSNRCRKKYHENDAEDPLIGIIGKNSNIIIKDGNRRLMEKIEEVASENRNNSNGKMKVWVAKAIGGREPQNYWIPTSTLMEINELFGLDTLLTDKFSIAQYEYNVRVRK